MNFRILESQVVPKDGASGHCEDRIVLNNDFVCVIDGVTTKSEFLFDNKTSGLRVSEILEESILELRRDSTLLECTNTLTDAISAFYRRNQLAEHMRMNPVDRLAASMAIYSRCHGQIWLIGDCKCMTGGKEFSNPKVVDGLLAETRSLYIMKELAEGKSVRELQNKDTGREYILPLLKAQAMFQNGNYNSEYSYSALDGFSIDIEQVKVIDVKDQPTLVLASDGYPKLFDSLRESEEYLEQVLTKDPLCYDLFKSTKGKGENSISFDDRAYVKCGDLCLR